MAGPDWSSWVAEELDAVRSAGRWREPRAFDALGPVGRRAPADAPMVSFASNDYLGLTAHPALQEAAVEAVRRWGTGAGASRLVVGSRPVHHELEEALAAWRGAEAAVLFPTGYAANTGLLAAIAGPDVTVLSDERNHASIIDGCRMARAGGAEVKVYRHADADHLATLLGQVRQDRRVVVVSDTVFSMDGDVAPVTDVAACCRDVGALLVLDDAHAVLEPPATPDGLVVLRVGTLSKALGSLGGFVAGPRPWAQLLVNLARPYIFTTAPSPADAAAALAALDLLGGPEGAVLLGQLRANVDRLAPGHPSPIVPVIVGEEGEALRVADALADRGLLVPAIRPPTVAPGTSRLRIALSAAHRPEQVDELAGALDELGWAP